MHKILMILEVSRKQDYIFGSKKLKENAARSADISFITSNNFFSKTARAYYSKEENYVYSGGGHTILQFPSKEIAKNFAAKITEFVIRQYNGLELFVKLMEYEESKTPGENLKELSKQLERKKSKRTSAFRFTSLGIEEMDEENYRPVLRKEEKQSEQQKNEQYEFQPPEGWKFPSQFEQLKFDSHKYKKIYPNLDDNFIAVIHIDGNSMGARVDNIYKKEKKSWDDCCKSLRLFSEGIQSDFEDSFSEMIDEIKNQELDSDILPVRPVILAGDDVCFVTAGCIGIECARIFLEKLSKKKNKEDQVFYSACAGIAFVHRKYPFHLAYNLAEELCSNAKKFGIRFDGQSRISAMDWHVEFGQLKDNLNEIRKDYETEDGNRLELRPFAVVLPMEEMVSPLQKYRFFKRMCILLQGREEKAEYKKISRSKMKDWRTALKQGEVETQYFLNDKRIKGILDYIFGAEFQTQEEKYEQYCKILAEKGIKDPEAFRFLDGEKQKHCIFFDAIEMMDHFIFFEEESK